MSHLFSPQKKEAWFKETEMPLQVQAPSNVGHASKAAPSATVKKEPDRDKTKAKAKKSRKEEEEWVKLPV